ncbi:acetate uptake transporter [Sciscionella sediminilitoris]|uniref:acetate uptake transporter n=1 Tax=Sciscionella sediminilitoris TaxID=1445613 RepID=UPI0004DF7D03|nr:GPR1/FUN34/YaaH family transporter [Sciscionella sp. SE31]
MASTEETKPVSDPAPFGLASFAGTTFVLSLVNAGLVAKDVEPVVLPLALFIGGLGQLIACVWEIRNNNTFGATAFGTYGGFWCAFAFFVWLFSEKIPENHAATATGLFLLIFAVFTAYMTIGALRTTAALASVFFFLFLTFLFLTLGELAAESLGKIGGWLGLLTALLAWYTSFAGILKATFKRDVLPVRPLS